MGFISALSRICLDMTVVTFLILWFPWFPPYTTYTQVEGRIHEYFKGGGSDSEHITPSP